MRKLLGPIYISDWNHGWRLVGKGIYSRSPYGYFQVFKQIKGRVYLKIYECEK